MALVHGVAAALFCAVAALVLASLSVARRISETRFGLVIGASFALATVASVRAATLLPANWPAEVTPTTLFLFLAVAGLVFAGWLPTSIRSRSLLVALSIVVLASMGGQLFRNRQRPAPAHGAAGPHVFLLVLDTVRADHLSVYGYERDTTPRLAQRLRTRVRSSIRGRFRMGPGRRRATQHC